VKFRSERDALVDMLATAGRAVGGRGGSSPVLLGLLLSCSGNALSVTGTDLDLTIQVTDEVIGINDGSCVVPARLSTDIRAAARAGCGDPQRTKATKSQFRRPARRSGSTRIPSWNSAGRQDERALHPSFRVVARRGRAPGGPGRLTRRRPPLLTGVLLAHI